MRWKPSDLENFQGRESGRTKGGAPTLVEHGHSVDMLGGSSVLIELSNH